VRAVAEGRQERPRAPHRPEVVRAQHGLDPLGVGGEEVGARGDPGVVDEQPEPWMATEHARGHRVHLLAVADVARFVLVRVRGRRP
jgi:hypothetical protein